MYIDLMNYNRYMRYIICKNNRIMNNLYQGGQCNVNSMGTSSNQYKNAMHEMTNGNKNTERIINHQQQGKNL